MPDTIFEIQDVYGTSVRLLTRRLEMHIRVKHADVVPYIDEAKEVISNPGIVTEDNLGSYHFSRLGAVQDGDKAGLYLEVVVDYRGEPDAVFGEVLTVHFNGKPPKGVLKWMKR